MSRARVWNTNAFKELGKIGCEWVVGITVSYGEFMKYSSSATGFDIECNIVLKLSLIKAWTSVSATHFAKLDMDLGLGCALHEFVRLQLEERGRL